MATQRQTVNAKLAEKGVATFYVARVDTSHFSFEAFGVTEDDARIALSAVLLKHRNQYGLALGWAQDMAGDANVERRKFGVGYRDGETVPGWRKAEGS